jgi:hypothetical protein
MRQARLHTALAVLLSGVVAAACPELTSPTEDEGGGSGGGGGSRNAGGGAPAIYAGTYQNEVRHLLNRVSGWRTSTNAQTDGGVPPNVSIGAGCIRDTYVAAAVNYAWAAESYYRLNSANASPMAANMRSQLNSGNSLCSNASSGGLNNCRTLSIWGCPAPY